MVEKPSVSAFQNFLRIENQLNIKKVMGKKRVDVFCIDSVDIDSIECIRDPCPVSTVSTYIVSAFQNFLWIENRLNIKARGHFIQSRVEFSHLIVLCIRCCVRATNTSVSIVSKNIAFNALHALIFVSTVSTN